MKLSTESYKGVRDFYPEDQFVQNYIYSVWKKTVRSFGYEEYNASILEPSELYKQKSGEEIISEQTYTFKDRGDREVTLRPEMTPTLARMVAGKIHDLSFPLRWFSIPNLFRYEKPQRGRLREHWQLNVDFFGVQSVLADVEIITIAYKIMKAFGAKDDDFVIKINDRNIVNALYLKFGLDEEKSYKVSKIIDKKSKISEDSFKETLNEILGEKTSEFIRLLSKNEELLSSFEEKEKISKDLLNLIDGLKNAGIENVLFEPTLMRGFDYYTGIVFEVFDTNPENSRSVFGGGRYDDLLDIFGVKKVSAVGFGVGDVTTRDFLESHSLLPKYRPATDVFVCTLKEEFLTKADETARVLREKGINVSVDLSGKKVGDQIKTANKQSIPYVLCIGEDEVKSGIFPLRNMETGEEKKVKIDEISQIVKHDTDNLSRKADE
ncbi:MAG: histidine--tRNA ligase [Minisyncoccia bacterium]